MIQVDLIRRRVMRALHEVKIYISCLADREEEALKRLHGQEGVERTARIADYVLSELGHEVTLPEEAMYSQSRRAAQAIRTGPAGEVTVEGNIVKPSKRRGRPKKNMGAVAA